MMLQFVRHGETTGSSGRPLLSMTVGPSSSENLCDDCPGENILTERSRRAFLRAGSSFAFFQGVRSLSSAQAPPQATPRLPIIDTHIHLFDPGRTGGVPWPERSDTVLYRPALPPRYESLAQPFGVVGAIAVECSPWVKDNDWLLQVAAHNKIMLGIIGNLDPASNDFPRELHHLQANPLFRGIRYGNLWGRSLGRTIRQQ